MIDKTVFAIIAIIALAILEYLTREPAPYRTPPCLHAFKKVSLGSWKLLTVGYRAAKKKLLP
jgi:hypothetical protein